MASVDYLIDHVAAGDGRATDPGASAMTRYYTAEGYPPGTWMGAGLAALGAANMVGSAVTEAQLRELFEQSRSPFGGRQLGRPPAKYRTRQERIDRRVGKIPETLAPEARAALVEKITAEEKENKTRVAVAGFDLTFSVPKSVSALWALAAAPVQEQLYLAHRAALAATFERIEAEAAFTRMGTHGVRRVRATGLVAAAFDHWDLHVMTPGKRVWVSARPGSSTVPMNATMSWYPTRDPSQCTHSHRAGSSDCSSSSSPVSCA
jgi:hypothetical protein